VSARALEGITVVALEQAVAAPYCTARMADAGARVIKVERPEGDFARGYDRNIHGDSAYFVWLNRGKESLVLDLKAAADRALLERIVAKADVFIQNLKPGVTARLGLDSARLRADYPRLVTCDISGYGDCEAYGEMKAYDMLVQAESGLCSITGSPEQPGRLGVSGCDIACGMNAFMGVMQALLARERSGRGRGVATSLFEGMADWMAVPLMMLEYGGAAPARTGLSHPMIQPYGAFATRGGAPILISVQNQREYERLCNEVLERPGLLTDPRFATNQARVDNTQAMRDAIETVFKALPREQLLQRLRDAQIAYGAVNGVEELSRHPALKRICIATAHGDIRSAAAAVRDLEAPGIAGAVPALGEHSGAIREEFT
jgi:crotonobetainyl-CoA:carnitine CoA-transferase CaiB-like acyl-CoA transferase